MNVVANKSLDGHTLTFITDTHSGKGFTRDGETSFLTKQQHLKCVKDINFLKTFSDNIVFGGDLIDWFNPNPENEDIEFIEFVSEINGYPSSVMLVNGNHDLARAFDPHQYRLGTEWATTLNTNLYNYKDFGAYQVVALSQTRMRFNEWVDPARAATDPRESVKPGRGFMLTDNEYNPYDESTGLGFLRSKLLNNKPTWLVIHYPIKEHFTDQPLDIETSTKLTEIISTSSVIGVLSGHRHAHPINDSEHVKEVTVASTGGFKVIASVNGSSAGGQTRGTTAYPYDSFFIATVVSWKQGKVTVRQRDMIRREWIKFHAGDYSKVLNVDV